MPESEHEDPKEQLKTRLMIEIIDNMKLSILRMFFFFFPTFRHKTSQFVSIKIKHPLHSILVLFLMIFKLQGKLL